MSSALKQGNATLRTVFVIGLALAYFCVTAIDLVRVWHPAGTYGYGTNLDGLVTGVSPGSPADSAGMRVGDRLDESKMTPQQLEELVQFPIVSGPGVTRTFDVLRHGVRHTLTMKSIAELMGPVEISGLVAALISVFVFLAIGAAVVLLKPEPATWGFYFFCLGIAPADWSGLNTLITAPTIQIAQMLQQLVNAGALGGLLVFSLRFLQPTVHGWRRIALYCVPLFYLGLAAFEVAQTIFVYLLARPAESIAHAIVALSAVGGVVIVFALIDTLLHRRGVERQRMRWVVAGFAVALLAQVTVTIILTEATTTSLVLIEVISIVPLVAPITVAYAIVKHRIIDVNFVISRTLVYGILTTVFVGLFGLIDWFVGRVLDQTRWALVAEIAVAIGIGFWLNGVHARIDRLVDSVLFRRRHEAERRLARLARGLPHATSSALVDASLVAEPRDALDLGSAALFRRSIDGRYERTIAAGWPDGMAPSLGSDDPLILHLQAERGALRLSELHWARDDAGSAGTRPAIALPIVVRHELEAIALFGAHRGGEDFDSDELSWLNSLAVAAGAAYDHLEADALRQELDRVQRESESRRVALMQLGSISAESS